MILLAGIATANAGFTGCSGDEQTKITDCHKGCDPAVTASSESALDDKGCDAWSCHMYCLKALYDDGEIVSKCFVDGSEKCDADAAVSKCVDCNSAPSTRSFSVAVITAAMWFAM